LGAKILLVEDDDFFREAIGDLLKKNKFEVLQAPNGKSAREILTVQDPDLVLTDIQMPGLTGLELLEWSKTNKPIPFVVMTGFSMILETQSAFDLGAKGFIAKPFKNTDLIHTIHSVLGPKEKQTQDPAGLDGNYCKVSIDEFVSRPKIEFDVYVRLSEHKYIKIAHKGDEIPRDKVNQYKAKGIRYLHILKEDFGQLVNFNLNLAKMVNDRSEISQEKKMNFIKYTAEVILEKAFVAGVDKQSFADAQTLLALTTNTIGQSEEHVDLLNVLNSHSDHIYAHSLGVAMYSIMIARKLNFESSQVFFKLSMAGMFHDIGKKEVDREILEKPRHLLSSKERKQIESHVVRGQEILMGIRGIPEDVVKMVYEHHEDLQGQGYPTAKSKKDLHPLSRILQVANLFIEQSLKGPHTEGMSGKAAIAYLERIYGDRLDRDSLDALKSLFPG
jgi:putative nucleotidyltransferase with HDIG domain